MKAVAVRPGVKQSAFVADLPDPRLESIPNGRGVLVRTLQVGVDATDGEINEGLYGAAPKGDHGAEIMESFQFVHKSG